MVDVQPPSPVPRPEVESRWPGGSSAPVELTSFVGRAQELEQVSALLLEGARLVTLTGAGGSGKTRLALKTAERVREASGIAVQWVELAELSEPELLPQFVSEQLGLQQEGSRAALEVLQERLGERQLLLVLDNCEHLVDAAALLVETLLRRCPGLRVLATSREALGIGGERAWLVPPLSLTPGTDEGRAEEAPVPEAVQLFVERAQEAMQSFVLSRDNAATVAAICERLDGLPLAIELAAARVRVLSPEQILAHLRDIFRLLTAGRRTALPRQQTLRATIDWSFALLGEEEKLLLARLSAFRGGFTLEAVEVVCADERIPPLQILDLLSRLVDRSLVDMWEVELSARYSLLETVRQYAAERLQASEEDVRLHRRHTAFYAALVADAEPHLTTPERPRWVSRVQRELANIREALAWSRENDQELHLSLVGKLCWFWFSIGALSEGQRWAEDALELAAAEGATRERASVLFAAGMVAALQARTDEAQRLLEEGVALARAAGEPRLWAYASNYLGMALVQQGRSDGATPVRAALEWFRAHGDLYGSRLSLLLLGSLAATQGDLEAAVRWCEEAVEVARSFGLPRELSISLQLLASWRLQQADAAAAQALLHESLLALREDPQHLFLSRALEMLGAVASEQGQDAAALRLWGAAEMIREKIGANRYRADGDRLLPRIERVRAAVDPQTFSRHWEEGKRWTLGQAFAFAIEWSGDTGAAASSAPEPGSLSVRAEPEEVRSGSADEGSGASLRVRALGPLEVLGDGAAVPESGSGRPFELFVYLLCHAAGCTRAQVGGALWPESSPSQVKNSFHVVLHRLRNATGIGDLVVRDGERYRINPALSIWFDVAVFEEEVRAALRRLAAGEDLRGSLEAALALYRDDFLAGSAAGEWRFPIHDRLRALYVEGLSAVAELQLQEEDFPGASRTLQRLLSKDDLREEAHRSLMHCYAVTGQRERALRQYDRFANLLAHELGEEPERETTALAERIRKGQVARAGG